MLNKFTRALCYDYLDVSELVKITCLSKNERKMVFEKTYESGIISSKPLYIRLSSFFKSDQWLEIATKICGQVRLNVDSSVADNKSQVQIRIRDIFKIFKRCKN